MTVITARAPIQSRGSRRLLNSTARIRRESNLLADPAFLLAGAVFAVGHVQIVMPILAPLALTFSVLIAQTSRFPRGTHRSLIAGLVILAIAVGGIALAMLNGITEGVSSVAYVRDRAPFVYVAVIAFGLASTRPTRQSAANFCIGFAMVAALAAAVTAGVALSGGEFLGEFRLVRRGRYQGFLSGPNSFAGVLAPAVLCAIAFWRLESRVWRVARFPVVSLCAFALMMTASRGYLLGMVLAGVALAGLLRPQNWQRQSGRTLTSLLGVAALGGTAYIAAAERISSLSDDRNVTSRVDFWKRAADLITDSPLIGYGFGIFEQHDLVLDRSLPLFAGRAQGSFRQELVQFEADGGQHAHNFFLQMGVDVGLLGLGVYLAILIIGGRRSRIGVALLVLGGIAGLFGGYALASASGSAPLLILCLGEIGHRGRKTRLSSQIYQNSFSLSQTQNAETDGASGSDPRVASSLLRSVTSGGGPRMNNTFEKRK